MSDAMDEERQRIRERKERELRQRLESGVDLQACQMTIDLMDYDEDDFYDGVTTGVGAATALQHMAESDVQLLV